MGTEAAIRKLAARTGESLTEAVANAVREKLARIEQEAEKNAPARTVEEFLERIPEAMSLSTRLFQYASRLIPVAVIVEGTMVLSRLHKDPNAVMEAYVASLQLTPVPIDAAIAELARDAFVQFGKSRHPARLNLAECFSYAAARALNAPLLYGGGDFARTGLRMA